MPRMPHKATQYVIAFRKATSGNLPEVPEAWRSDREKDRKRDRSPISINPSIPQLLSG